MSHGCFPQFFSFALDSSIDCFSDFRYFCRFFLRLIAYESEAESTEISEVGHVLQLGSNEQEQQQAFSFFASSPAAGDEAKNEKANPPMREGLSKR